MLLAAVDLGTQDIVDAMLAKHEDFPSIRSFLRELRDMIHYSPKEAVIDLDPAWNEAVLNVFPDVPIQLCIVHFKRIVERTIPQRKRTRKQEQTARPKCETHRRVSSFSTPPYNGKLFD